MSNYTETFYFNRMKVRTTKTKSLSTKTTPSLSIIFRRCLKRQTLSRPNSTYRRLKRCRDPTRWNRRLNRRQSFRRISDRSRSANFHWRIGNVVVFRLKTLTNLVIIIARLKPVYAQLEELNLQFLYLV